MKGEEEADRIAQYKELIERSKKGIEMAKKLIEEDKARREKIAGVSATTPATMIRKEIPARPEAIEKPVVEKPEVKELEEKGILPPYDKPVLEHIRKDYMTTVLVMRWIEFLFERVKRDKITLVLDYYKDIGWISEEVKAQIMAYARGETQDVTKYEEIEAAVEKDEKLLPEYKNINDWRLTAEDHLKSLLFIWKIAGRDVDKDKLNSLEQQISAFKKSLEGYHGV